MSDIKMPQLGESVTEGTLGKWLKNVGDSVVKYEPLVEVVTDKVTAEVPSDYDGVLTELLIAEGETVSVGTVICRVTVAGEASAPSTTATATAAESQPTAPSVAAAPASATAGRGRFSPAVLRLADEHGIDLAQVTGTGEGGRITRKDILKYAQSGAANQPPTTASSSAPATAVAQPTNGAQTAAAQPPAAAQRGSAKVSADDEVIEPSPVRKTIAKRMVESKHTAPHAWTMVEADVTTLAGFRQSVKSEFKRREGIDLTYLPFFIKAVVDGLKQYPLLNSAWIDDKIHMHRGINISIAVATNDALVVPVIKNADRLSVAGLAHAVNELAAKARSGRLAVDDMQGGTFTVNNTGAFGSILSQPIINMPQAAILSVESIVKRPMVVNDAIAIRSMVNLCLSLDHRVLDGWVSGQFLKAVKERLQAFGPDTVLY